MIDVEHGQKDERFANALSAHGTEASLRDRLSGGSRNDVREVRIAGQRYAARLSPRPAAAIAWELDLLARLAKNGLRVPLPVPARDGRLQVDGLVVFTWLDGDPPESNQDWRQVADYLDRLHALTTTWPQRPGFRGTRELLTEETGGDVRLDLMPPEAVSRCRDAWRPISIEPRAVVHSDPGAANIRITRAGAGLVDWDEARIDAPILDLAALPSSSLTVLPRRLELARRAALAWEAANGWTVESDYARRCLAQLMDMACTRPMPPALSNDTPGFG